MPKLSIVITNYNYANYLPECIESILTQNFEDFELIISDDGSTDSSCEVISKYAKQDSRIRPFFFPKNRGLHTTRKEGLAHALGDYVHTHSPDDLYLAGFLSQSMDILLANPELKMSCCNLRYFGDVEKQTHILDRSEPEVLMPHAVMRLFQTSDFWITAPTCITKRGVIEKHGGYVRGLENLDDWFLSHRIALHEGVAYLPETLLAIRQQSNSLTQAVKKNSKRRRATYWALLNTLQKKENHQTKQLFKKSSTLAFVFENLFWKTLLTPQYWSYIPAIKEPMQKRLKRSMQKHFKLSR